MRSALSIVMLAASLGCVDGAAAAGPVIEWLPPETLSAARLPDDPEWRKVVESLPGWWMESPNVTAPAAPLSTRPEETWVAVHVFAGEGECAFAHAAAPALEEAAPAALRAARRAAAIVNARPDQVAVFLGQRKIVLDERMLPFSDWGEPVARGRTGFLCFDGTAVRDAISPFLVLRRNEVRFRPLLEQGKQLPEWHVYTGRQFLLKLSSDPISVTELLRGKPFIGVSRITRAEVGQMASQAAGCEVWTPRGGCLIAFPLTVVTKAPLWTAKMNCVSGWPPGL